MIAAPAAHRSLFLAGLIAATLVAALMWTHGPRSAAANGVTSIIAEGKAGALDYVVGIGLFSPRRGLLFMSVSLSSRQSPVSDAEVYVSTTVDNGPYAVGPLQACNSPLHPASYDLWVAFDPPARDIIAFDIRVDSSLGKGSFVAEVVVPRGSGSRSLDDAGVESSTPSPTEAEVTGCAGAPGGSPTYAIVGTAAGIAALSLGAWGLGLYRRSIAGRS